MSEPAIASAPKTVGWSSGHPWVRVRVIIAALLLSSVFALLAYKAYVLQVRESERFTEMAEDQYLRDVDLPARRGRLLDRNGNELAVSAEVDSLYANPRQVASGAGVEPVARALAKALGIDKKDLVKRLSTRRYFSWLARQVVPEEARAVRELLSSAPAMMKGVYLTKEPRRYYPNKTLAGVLIGWSGLDGKGLEGIELRHDKELKGAPAEVQGLRDALGREVLPQGMGDAAPQGGHDVVTTIDKFIQYRLERALEAGVAAHHAKAASAVAIDPRTGEILAMASVPTVNPNDPSSAPSGVRNRAVTDPFEPGSTMKAFTLTGAIEANLVKPDDHWFCENGKYQIGSATIHDAEKIGNVTTTQVLAQSSNICTSKIARRLGRDRLDNVLRRFGFGAQSGIDLPGERAGLLRPVKRWGEIELATISFGQGLTATQLQLVRAYSAIANGGTLYQPHVVRKVVDETGKVVNEVAPEGHRVVDEKTALTIREMLHAVTLKGGTGEKLAIPGYPAAGKTATAQKVDPATHRYSPDKWMSSFVGFAPYEDPRVVIMVTVDEPQGVHYGGSVAGPIWREVMIDVLRYLGVSPTEPVAVEKVAAEKKPAAPVAPAAPSAAEEEDDEGADDEASAGASLGGIDLPDFHGRSMRAVLDEARRLRVAIEPSGSGLCVAQNPGPGPIEEGARVTVRFSPDGADEQDHEQRSETDHPRAPAP